MAYRTSKVVPESTIPGTRKWAETVASNARQYAGFTEKDVRPLVERFRQLCDYQAWELWYPGQMESRERFFRDVLGYDAEFLDTMSKGVEILDGRGHEGAVTPRAATLAVKGANAEKGKKGFQRTDNVSPLEYGNSESYTLRRLRRDNPELADRVERRELSANAAAVKAGIRPRTITVPATRPEAAARSLRRHMTPSDLQELITYLGDGNK